MSTRSSGKAVITNSGSLRCDHRSLSVGKNFLHPLDDFRRRVENLFHQRFKLFTGRGVDIHPAFFRFGQIHGSDHAKCQRFQEVSATESCFPVLALHFLGKFAPVSFTPKTNEFQTFQPFHRFAPVKSF